MKINLNAITNVNISTIGERNGEISWRLIDYLFHCYFSFGLFIISSFTIYYWPSVYLLLLAFYYYPISYLPIVILVLLVDGMVVRKIDRWRI